jgi:signal transduction histidine kinase
MRLADYIATHQDAILAEWAAFARTLGPASQETHVAALQEDAGKMLDAIVTDLRTPESESQREDKSKGKASGTMSGATTAAKTHGTVRAKGGFSMGEMVSEYRALRASVIRLWTASNGTLTREHHEDLIRFNETIDQALAEATEQFTLEVEEAKNMFIAILGHDLRIPMDASLMAAQHLLDTEESGGPQSALLHVVSRSTKRMAQMVADLLDFTRGFTGDAMPITRKEVDLGCVVREAVDEIAMAEPESVFECTTTGDLNGCWDEARLGQVLSNLLGNAVQHGTPKSPISVTAEVDVTDVVLRVHSEGAPIPADEIPLLFRPFNTLRDRANSVPPSDTHLGLGLFIAERIADAHGGTIGVHSSASEGTTFDVRLPRVTECSSGPSRE